MTGKLKAGMCATEAYGDSNCKKKVWIVHRPSVDGAGVSKPHFDLVSKASGTKSRGDVKLVHGRVGS